MSEVRDRAADKEHPNKTGLGIIAQRIFKQGWDAHESQLSSENKEKDKDFQAVCKDRDRLFEELNSYRIENKALKEENDRLFAAAMGGINNDLHQLCKDFEAENKALREALEKCLPAIEAAWWDNYTAGTMPGSGYHHRVYNLLPFNWRQKDQFVQWLKETKEALGKVKS